MNTSKNLCSIILALTVYLGPATSIAGIKCWTNNEGIKECGNVVPPEFSQKGHEEISNQGITVRKQSRAKTIDEIEQEKEAKRQEKQRDKLAQEQAIRDRNLLNTFATQEELIFARDDKLKVIDEQIDHQKRISADLTLDLEALATLAADQERSGKAVSEELLDDIEALKRQIGESSDFVIKRQQERVSLEDQFKSDLNRYQKLKGN